MEAIERTQLFLVPAEAQQFLLFQEYYEPITTIINAGVFQVRNGSVSLHFDHLGILQTVQRSDQLYSRKYSV